VGAIKMKNCLYITGHKNPDSDSICSAIAYAEFKNRTGEVPAIPVRLGDINRETKFILNYFNVESPVLLETVKTQIEDLNIDSITSISSEISIKMAWSLMKRNNVKTLPVVDDKNKFAGIVTVSNLSSSYTDEWDNTVLFKSNTKIENILYTLSGKEIYINNEALILKGKIIISSSQISTLETYIEEGDIVLCGDRMDDQEAVINSKASLLIITGDCIVDNTLVEKARLTGCSIIQTPHDVFTVSRLITQCIPVGHVMTKENITYFSIDDYIDDVREVMMENRYRRYPVLDKENKIIGSISRYHLISKNKKKVILVDHNEWAQSVNGIEDAEVLEIIDHHRVADIQTGNPIYFRNEPVGSTSTIIGSIFFENGIRPSKKIAGLLCGAIISDTLYLKSPTATNEDKLVLSRLAEIAGVDTDKFASDMFKAGTSLVDKTPLEIINQDFKSFNINNKKLGVAQISTLDTESFSLIKKELLALLEEKALIESYDLVILMLTDILRAGSEFIVAGNEKGLAAKAFNVKCTEECFYLQDIVSRKKQVIPYLTQAINSL
jgi:manganese-dependent inorganic pyrophosphatase